MAKQLSEKDLFTLRQRGLLTESEIAFKDGSVVIAEDIVTKMRRVVEVAGLILEADRQILLD